MLRKNFKRLYTAAQQQHSAVTYNRKGEQVATAVFPVKTLSKTSTGVSVATVDQLGPLSSIALVINAGSRHESPDALGAAHFWKNSFIRTIPGDTVIRTVREAELRGNAISTLATREQLILSADFLRDDLVDVVPELVSNFLNKNYEVYEFLDTREQVLEETDAALSDPLTIAVENLHAAAFRHGLGNSVFGTRGNVENLKRRSLEDFASKWFVPERVALVGRNVHHKDLTSLVEKAFASFTLSSNATTTPSVKSKYYGGEHRVDAGNGSSSEYFLAFPSVSLGSLKYATALVLTSLLDGSKKYKWGSSVAGLLSKAASDQVSVRAFNTSYSDAGLFGFHVSSESAAAVKPALQAAIDALKSATSVTEAQLNSAKKAALISLEAGREQEISRLAGLLFANKAILDSKDIGDAIAKVTVSDVSKFVKGVLSSKPTASSVGPSSLVYLDELKF